MVDETFGPPVVATWTPSATGIRWGNLRSICSTRDVLGECDGIVAECSQSHRMQRVWLDLLVRADVQYRQLRQPAFLP